MKTGNCGKLTGLEKGKEQEKWKKGGLEFEKVEVDVLTFNDFRTKKVPGMFRFDFITIDAEGMDLAILQQIDLTKYQTKLVCIEHNSVPEAKEAMIAYCRSHGLVEIIYESGENVIMGV